jgi:hypothetical protein
MADHFFQDLGAVVMSLALTQLAVQGDEERHRVALIARLAWLAVDPAELR